MARRRGARSTGRRPRRSSARACSPAGSRRSARRTRAWNARSRLNACTMAMPETDSASCAVIAEIVFRTSMNAACERTWNQRVRTSAGGRTTSATSAEPPVEDEERRSGRRQLSEFGDERREPLREDVRERVDVARQPRDDPAGALLARSSAARARQVLEEVARAARARSPWPSRRGRGSGRAQDPAGRVDRDVDDDDRARGALVVAARMPWSIASCRRAASRPGADGAERRRAPTSAARRAAAGRAR